MTIQNIIVQDTNIPDEVILKKEPNTMWIRPGFGRFFFTDFKGESLSGSNLSKPISFNDNWSLMEDVADDLHLRGQDESTIAAMIPFFTALKNQVLRSLHTSQNTEGGYKAANGTDLLNHLRLALYKAVMNIDPTVKEWKYRKLSNINFPFPDLDVIKPNHPEIFTQLAESFTSMWTTCNKPLAIQYLEMFIAHLEVFNPSNVILENNIITENRTTAINFTNALFDLILSRLIL